jgi:uncharacterized iron-regulated membrane protein
MRRLLGLLHRWVGLALAGFVCLSGLTGAVIVWNSELDLLLNPQLLRAAGSGPAIPAADLAARLEARAPHLRVTYFALQPPPGRSLALFVMPRIDPASGRPYALDYDQVFLDPATGAELGRRARNAVWPVTRETAVAFVYRLHQTLHLSGLWGIERLGHWIMGGVALVWALHSIGGFWLTLPPLRRRGRSWWARWAPAWKMNTAAGGFRLALDLHRALGLWAWLLFFLAAVSGVALNLQREVFQPLLTILSPVTPTPYDQRPRQPRGRPLEPGVGFAAIQAAAADEGRRRGWTVPVGALLYAPDYGLYHARFFHPGDERGRAGLGNARLFFDGGDGRLLGERVPDRGSAADIVIQAAFPVHSGRILGLPGRILVSLLGLLAAMAAVAGVVVWWRRRPVASAGGIAGRKIAP